MVANVERKNKKKANKNGEGEKKGNVHSYHVFIHKYIIFKNLIPSSVVRAFILGVQEAKKLIKYAIRYYKHKFKSKS